MVFTTVKPALQGYEMKNNNAEYSYFAGQMIARILADGIETLHIPEGIFMAYKGV